MSQANNIVSSGLSAIQAQAIVGTVANNLTATGSTQGTALPLPASVNRFTTVAASTGALVPPMNPGDYIVIYNGGANALSVYPPVGATINQASANTAYSLATATPFLDIFCVAPLTYIGTSGV